MANVRKRVSKPIGYDPADAARIEQLLAELREAETPEERDRISAKLDDLIFGPTVQPAHVA